MIWLIDLPTGTAQKVTFPRAFSEGGTYSVAYAIDGALLISGTFEGSGWVPLRRNDPATGGTEEIRVGGWSSVYRGGSISS